MRYIVVTILGILLTPLAVYIAYIQRGHWAVGGEYLLPLLFVGALWVVDEVKEMTE